MIEQMPTTQGEARRWLVDRIIAVSAERRVGTDVAQEIVLAETLEQGGDWWKLFGGFCLGLILDAAIEQGQQGQPKTMARSAGATRPVDNWREGGDSIWNRIVPIPTVGLRRYGELTRADLLAISTFYERQASTMRKKAAWFRTAAGCLADDTTLEQVVGKLPKDVLAFFESEGRVKDQPEPLNLSPAVQVVQQKAGGATDG